MYRRTTEDELNSGNLVDDEVSRPVRGIELMTRHSIYSIASMGTERSDDRTQHHKWNLKDLRVRRSCYIFDIYQFSIKR